jgi:hypothetical protein
MGVYQIGLKSPWAKISLRKKEKRKKERKKEGKKERKKKEKKKRANSCKDMCSVCFDSVITCLIV